MSDSAQVKLAVIGVGALGRHHARILAGMKDVELVAVADANPVQAKKVASLAPCAWTTDYREFLERIDAAVIAAPTFAHRAIGEELLGRDIPIMVEKPLANCVADAEALANKAAEKNLTLQVGHVERFNPAYQAVKEATKNPKYIRTERFSPFAFRSMDIGVVHDLMIHDLDLVLDLVDSPIKKLKAFGVSILGSHEDAVQTRITFENGCIADLSVNRVNPSAARTIQTWAPTGCATANLTTREVKVFNPSEGLIGGASPIEKAKQPGADIDQLKAEMFSGTLTTDEPEVSDADALTAELSAFVDCVRTGTAPICGGQEAVAALKAADAVLLSVAAHQWDGSAEGPVGPFAWFNDSEQISKAA
ncbi:Gfo/Idh/MocA family protein [Calycomorphotria hydatis]|uniref:Dehydrogenase n=1 Tax=Calycomorphotria hydatis TaxID=2528027 RepID=A0A517T3Z4_9PLAN|nr:Gfo/Idh/MocA family oxidoreductase [Calycomorphotria hydatis]QDT63092.1 Dehydrogenase [Calycomorphotria hydatis]